MASAYEKGSGFAILIQFDNYTVAPLQNDTVIEKTKNNLQALGFGTFVAKNWPLEQVERLISTCEDGSKANFQQHKGLVVVVAAHGHEQNFQTTDGGDIDYRDLVRRFCKNESLQNKPKLFIFSCCHGDKKDKGLQLGTNTKDKAKVCGSIPTDQDTLLVFAATYGNVAWAHRTDGHALLTTLNTVLEKHLIAAKYSDCYEVSIYDLLTEVNGYIAALPIKDVDGEWKQMSEFVSRLVKLWKLDFKSTVKPNEEQLCGMFTAVCNELPVYPELCKLKKTRDQLLKYKRVQNLPVDEAIKKVTEEINEMQLKNSENHRQVREPESEVRAVEEDPRPVENPITESQPARTSTDERAADNFTLPNSSAYEPTKKPVG